MTAAAKPPLGLLVNRFPKLSETFILEEVLGLERLGVPLRIYALAPPSDALTHPAVARVRAPVVCVPELALNNTHQFLLRHAKCFLSAPLRYVATLGVSLSRGRDGVREFVKAGWLAQQLRSDGVGHLHTHFISTPADVAAIVAQLAAIPFSISAHAKDIYLSNPADLKRKLEAARFTVTCTEFNRTTLSAIAPNAIVHRMYHGIDQMVFQPRPHASNVAVPLILSVGRLREKKGLDSLIDACAVLRDRGQDFRCEIVGYGEEQARLLARVLGHRLTQHVHLVGKLQREQVIDRYARATVYVQPSRIAADGDRDGIPNVLLEAMAMGLPAVATRISGIPEVIEHRRNGLLVEPDALIELADAIEDLLNRPTLRDQLGCAARVTVTENFNNDHNLQLLCRLLDSEQKETKHERSTQSVALEPSATLGRVNG